MLSPAFKVRDFSVNDVTLYPIALSWSSSGGAGAEAMEVDGENEDAPKATGSNTVVFSKFNSVPNTKMLTFYRKDTFTLTAAYDGTCKLPNGFPTKLSEHTVADIPKGVPDAEGKVEPAKIKVKLRLDIHGCLVLESAVAVEEELVDEEPEVVKVPPPPAADAKPADPPVEGAAADAEMPAAEAAPAEAPKEEPPAEAAPEPPKKKKKVRRIPLKVDSKSPGMSEKEMMDAQEQEANMSHADKLVTETEDAKNDLESFVYSIRDQLGTRYQKFASEAEHSTMSSKLTAMEDWLYEDGEDEKKEVYVAKLAELKADVAPIILRENEADERPTAFKKLEAAIEKFAAFVASTDEEYAHIEKEQKDKAAAEVEAAKTFLAEMQGKVASLAPTADPPIKAADVSAKATALEAVCDPIMRTPKPVPKVEAAPEPAPAAEGEAAKPAEGEAAAEAPAPAAEGGSVPDNMDVD